MLFVAAPFTGNPSEHAYDIETIMIELKNLLLAVKNTNMVFISRRRNIVLEKPLFYYHVPKCAGLTFRFCIMWGQEYKFSMTKEPNLSGIKGQIFEWDRPHSASQLQQKYCSIAAWKPYGFHALFNQNFNLVTVVRDPFDRLVSRYRYLCNLSGAETSSEGFETFFREEPQINHQSKLLAGSRDNANSSIDLYDRAIGNLDDFLAFAPLDKANEMYENLIGLYDLPNVYGMRLNVSPKWTTFDWEPYREEVLNVNQIDKIVFDYVSENFRICSPSENELYAVSGSENDINAHTIAVRDSDKDRMFAYWGESTDLIIKDFTSNGFGKQQIESWLGEVNTLNPDPPGFDPSPE